ncbi:MAG: threonine/serine ThrE exporter family protein, partial [[Mycobacterium] stephanolepidis]
MTALTGRGRVRTLVRKALKDKPVPLADAKHFDDAEVVTMLRMLGIAMLEVGQPTNLVLAKLHDIAPQYTDKELRAVVLPTVLIIQIDGVTGQLEVEES